MSKIKKVIKKQFNAIEVPDFKLKNSNLSSSNVVTIKSKKIHLSYEFKPRDNLMRKRPISKKFIYFRAFFIINLRQVYITLLRKDYEFMINKTRKITILLVALFTISSCIISIGPHRYNMSPDLDSKVVGSKYAGSYTIPVPSIEDLKNHSDIIIIGEVIQSATMTFNKDFEDGSAIRSAEKTLLKKLWEGGATGGKVYSIAVSKIKVDKVIYGNLDDKEISLIQPGIIESDMIETKVKVGDKMFFFLNKSVEKNVNNAYRTCASEVGLFIIKPNNELLSLSDNKVFAKYDGINIDILLEDLSSTMKDT